MLTQVGYFSVVRVAMDHVRELKKPAKLLVGGCRSESIRKGMLLMMLLACA